MDGGYEWLEGVASRMKNEIEKGAAAAPETLKVRDLLWQFGFQRRGDWINNYIRKGLRKFKLRVDPDFRLLGLDSQIAIAIDSDAKDASRPSPPPDPTLRIGALAAATKSPVSVKPQSPLSEATLTMQMKNYSQLPVMRTDRDVSGMVTWKSINRRGSQEPECKLVDDCMDERVNDVPDNCRLFEAVRTVLDHEYVLVRAKDKTVTGIVTMADLLRQIGRLAEPFLLIGEIEGHLRNLIHGKFTLDQLRAASEEPGPNSRIEIPPARKVEGPEDLTFGGHCRLLENKDNWEQLALNIDRKTFVKHLHSVREIRNNVMHFNPDELDDDKRKELRDSARFFDKWRT